MAVAARKQRVPATYTQPPPLTDGTIGVLAGELSRYSDFWLALATCQKTEGTSMVCAQGVDIVGNMNTLVRNMRGDWLWILGDDHVFSQDLLIRLLAHNVDVVVPLCLKRTPPYDPVVYSRQNDQGMYVADNDLPEHGLHPIHAAGSAGMLVRRRVLDAIDKPIFQTDGSGLNEDLVFCRKIREAGFKIWVDCDSHIGHISNLEVWPEFRNGQWQIALHLGNRVVMPIARRIVDE